MLAFSNASSTARIDACKTGRGYIYMANRTGSWPSVESTGIALHFAELYSSQTTIDDQLSQWTGAGKPGDPMVNFGEASTSTSLRAGMSSLLAVDNRLVAIVV